MADFLVAVGPDDRIVAAVREDPDAAAIDSGVGHRTRLVTARADGPSLVGLGERTLEPSRWLELLGVDADARAETVVIARDVLFLEVDAEDDVLAFDVDDLGRIYVTVRAAAQQSGPGPRRPPRGDRVTAPRMM